MNPNSLVVQESEKRNEDRKSSIEAWENSTGEETVLSSSHRSLEFNFILSRRMRLGSAVEQPWDTVCIAVIINKKLTAQRAGQEEIGRGGLTQRACWEEEGWNLDSQQMQREQAMTVPC